MNYPLQDVLSRLDSAANRDGRKLQVIVVGCSEDITETIHTFHALDYADVGAWSPIVPVPNSTKRMSVLTRYR